MRAGLQALAWIAHGGAHDKNKRDSSARRSWAVLGEMAELGEDAITEHDRIGRLAVSFDVARLVYVGNREVDERHAPRGGHGGLLGRWR